MVLEFLSFEKLYEVGGGQVVMLKTIACLLLKSSPLFIVLQVVEHLALDAKGRVSMLDVNVLQSVVEACEDVFVITLSNSFVFALSNKLG